MNFFLMRQMRGQLALVGLGLGFWGSAILGAAENETAEAAAPAAVTPAVTPSQPGLAEASPALAQTPVAAEAAPEATAQAVAQPPLRSLTAGPAAAPSAPVVSAPQPEEVNFHTEDKLPMGHHHVAVGQITSEVVSVFGDTTVAGEVRHDAVAVFGHTTVTGKAGGDVVGVFGHAKMTGSAGGDVVSVFGHTKVDGPVGGDAVAVFGNLELGPKAVVSGEVVAVFGRVKRDPQAVVRGEVISVGGGLPSMGGWWSEDGGGWVRNCLLKVRLLGYAAGCGWAWIWAGLVLGFYLLMALALRRPLERCAETLEQRPGRSILAAVLALLFAPLLVVLLAITGVGLVLLPFLFVALLFASVFGRVAMLAWCGRRLAAPFGTGWWSHAAVSVLLGGVLINLLYSVPVLGFLLWHLLGFLGLGVVLYTIAWSITREKPARPVAVSTTPAGTPAVVALPPILGTAASVPAPVEGVPPVNVPASLVPPVASVLRAVDQPRAGFGLRMGALAIDIVLCGLLTAALHGLLPFTVVGGPGGFLMVMALYGAVLWKLRGTTIGGIVCNLQVARSDGRELDWSTVVVRALGCFLSLAVAGLGFLWVAFDDEHQAWHDKIAGTVVVRLPRGRSLV